METRCPHCKTRYQIDRDTLTAADGIVRCSRCRNIFNALKHLKSNAARKLPDVTAVDRNAKIESAPVSRPIEKADEIDIAEWDNSQQRGVTLDMEETLEAPQRQRARFMLGSLIAVVLLTALAAQLAWFERDRLMSDPRTREMLERACDHLGCELPLWTNPSQFQILQRKLAPSNDRPGELVLEARFSNGARVPQPLPVVQLTFLDTNEKVIARRRLIPSEYLTTPTVDGQLALPKEVFTIDVSLTDPGKDATGFEIDFY